MRILLHKIIVLYTCVLFFVTAEAQVYKARKYGRMDGLPSNAMNGITQDEAGLIWAVTSEGIATYDGITWSVFPDSLGLPNTQHTRIKRMEDGTLCIAGYYQKEFVVHLYKQGGWVSVFEKINTRDILSDLHSMDFYMQTGSIGGEQSLMVMFGQKQIFSYSFENETWKRVQLNELLKGTRLNTFNIFHDKLYLFGDGGVYTWNNDKFTQLLPDHPLLENHQIMYGIPSGEESMYLIAEGWLGKLSIAENELEILYEGPGSSHWHSANLLQTGDNLFMNDNYYFYKYHIPSGSMQPFRLEDDGVFPYRSHLFTDKENNLWIAHDRGLFKINDFRIMGLTKQDGLMETEVSAILEISPGRMMIGSNHGYSIIADHKIAVHEYPEGEGPGTYRTMELAVDNDGVVYLAGHQQGLGTLYPSGKLEWAHPGYAVTSIFVDRNEVFVGTSFGTIYRYSNKAFSLVSILPRSVVRDIKVFSNGDVAVAGNKGLFIVPDTIAITPVATDIRYTNTYCIYENPDGVWLGTEAGLAEIKDDEIAKWAVEGLSIDKPVYSILKTREGHLWFGTSDGAYYYDGISLKHFSEKDGLFGTDVSRNGLIQTSDGKIWIGTDKGISIYDPQGDISLKSIFDLKLLYAGGDDFSCLSTDTAMRVQHHNNDLEFKFRALSFYDESKINYRYRLVGFDDEWNYEENPEDNKVLYRHLPYGSFFQFEVQARLEEGPWTASVLSGHVLIKAPYYLQWWFIVAVALFFGAIGYLIRRVIGQAAYSKRLEGEVFEKTKEISRTYKTIQEQNIALKESEKRLENDLEQRKLYEVKLEQSNLELSTFFYRASHDLKGPLSSFRGLLYLSENKNNINDFDQFMRLMRKSLNHLDNILDNFITVGYIKESSIKSEPIDFEETIKVLLDELSIFKAMKKLQIHYEVNVFDTCYLDSRLIKAIFRNLIHNIIKYQKEGGSNLDITIHKSKQGLNIVFSDTGIGIPSAYHEKVFEMFFRASTLEKGSGLGLYIVKSSVEKLGGTLMMESEEGIGTSFKIFFPREGFQERKTKGLFTVPSGV